MDCRDSICAIRGEQAAGCTIGGELELLIEALVGFPIWFLWITCPIQFAHKKNRSIFTQNATSVCHPIRNLSSSNLNGKVPPAIASLSQLQHLVLSDNSLTAPVPKFIANLQLLTVLNLSRNMFNGSIPAELMERANQVSSPDQKTDVVDSRKTNQSQGSSKNRQFTHAELKRMTNNFGRVVGKGGFRTVYHGYLDETQVAVKMLSPSPVQGYKQFQAAVELLLRVHHRNLTTIVGSCDDGSNMGLIYEFMAKGNLAEYLKVDSSRGVLNWKGRLGIALETAHKLSDFGLSKAFPLEGDTHVITVVAGTPWYVDPDFGVVLLEIITNRPVTTKTYNQTTHISQWVGLTLSNGDMEAIADSRMQGDFEIASMACVSPTSTKRPTMNDVVTELNRCLSAEIDRNYSPNMDDDQRRHWSQRIGGSRLLRCREWLTTWRELSGKEDSVPFSVDTWMTLKQQ
ncbi:hypothetical protein J1N35_031415 [Gossypium stocksii]|uniref:Protein kinase domain-containing protein n=1 Tax=Gossypium stocksii TaxID=47602 RepID=A0A9D3ZUU3_9ROSI|nr:hypothetical protein J1N35_031415 [Gossypium stocksii]